MSASDAIELVLAVVLLACVILWRGAVERTVRKFAERAAGCMIVLALLPIVLRLLLLPHHPVPTPDVYDEFGHLFVADTLMHGRLSNPPHPLHQFFETFFILQTPTYSSIYPIGQGLAMEIGRVIFGVPWAGVVLSTGAFCALCYWMLRAWTTPVWSLAGGLLAVIEFGPLNPWMNNYWGGSFAAAGGCLVFGSLPRVRDRASAKSGALLGIGLGICLLTRPYESVFVLIAVILYLLPAWRNRAIIAVIVCALPAVGLTLLQNKRVTGNWTTLPYSLSQKQYGVPAALTFLRNPVPDRELSPQQQLEYKAQLAFRDEPETLRSYLLRLEFRVRYYRFFLSSAAVHRAAVFPGCIEGTQISVGGGDSGSDCAGNQFLSGISVSLSGAGRVPVRVDECDRFGAITRHECDCITIAFVFMFCAVCILVFDPSVRQQRVLRCDAAV